MRSRLIASLAVVLAAALVWRGADRSEHRVIVSGTEASAGDIVPSAATHGPGSGVSATTGPSMPPPPPTTSDALAGGVVSARRRPPTPGTSITLITVPGGGPTPSTRPPAPETTTSTTVATAPSTESATTTVTSAPTGGPAACASAPPRRLSERGAWLVPAQGGLPRRLHHDDDLATDPRSWPGEIVFAPDRATHAYTTFAIRQHHPESSLVVVAGGARTVVETQTNNEMSLTWSADSRQLAYWGQDGSGRMAIWVYDLAATTERLVHTYDTPADATTLQFTPDGRNLVRTHSGSSPDTPHPQADAHTGIWMVAVDSGVERRVVDEPVGMADVSPDGARLAYSTTAGAVKVVGTDGLHLQPVSATGWAPVWSPDGTHIAFQDGGTDVVDADGTGRRHVSSHRVLDWSPDASALIAWGTDGHHLLTLSSGCDQLVLAHDDWAANWGGWGPDDTLAFSAFRTR